MQDLLLKEVLNNGIFAIITVGLLLFTLKSNREREIQLYSILKEQGDKLAEITTVLQKLADRIHNLEKQNTSK